MNERYWVAWAIVSRRGKAMLLRPTWTRREAREALATGNYPKGARVISVRIFAAG